MEPIMPQVTEIQVTRASTKSLATIQLVTTPATLTATLTELPESVDMVDTVDMEGTEQDTEPDTAAVMAAMVVSAFITRSKELKRLLL